MIIYLHGFNSSANVNSDKVKLLSTIDEVYVAKYDSFHSYTDIFKDLTDAVEGFKNKVFVGTSLGGFYASKLAKHYSAPAVCINPCINPHISLRPLTNIPMTNYIDGAVKHLTSDVCNSYDSHEISEKSTFSVNPLLLLDRDDELLDSEFTAETLKSWETVIFEGGNHRFSHMLESIPHIKNYLRKN